MSRYKVRASQTENVEMMSMVGHTRQSPVFLLLFFSFSIRKSVQIQRNPGHIRTFHGKFYREKDGETSDSMKLRSCLILVKFLLDIYDDLENRFLNVVLFNLCLVF